MYKLTNNLDRSVALPCPAGSVVLDAGKSCDVNDEHYAALMKARHALEAIDRGDVVAEHFEDAPAEPEKPDVELISEGLGKWRGFVRGHEVTDGPVSKKEAKRILAEYE